MPCYSPLKGWKDFGTGGIRFDRSDTREEMEVACGQCLGCRLDRSRHWAMRIIHESGLHDASCFITLTYRSKEECNPLQLSRKLHIPDDWSLHHSHIQKFLKRLRFKLDEQGIKVRYYMCGEYGSRCIHNLDVTVYRHEECKVGRPHYHLCLFGFYPPVGEFLTDTVRESSWLDEIWKYGYTSVGELTFESAAYVSRYILKKVNGKNAEDHYIRIDDETGWRIFLKPEYTRMSLGKRCAKHRKLGYTDLNCPDCEGGIGAKWFEKYKDDCFPSDEVPVPGQGVIKSVPRFYDKLLERCDPELLEEVKAGRQEFYQENKEEFTPQRLWSKYKVKKAELELFQKRNEL